MSSRIITEALGQNGTMQLPIAQLGQPVLRRRAESVTPESIRSSDLQQFVTDLLETLRSAKGAGLAAPQLFRSERVFVAAVLPASQVDQPPLIDVFINPQITPLTTEEEAAWEGCLSFAELLVRVPRYRAVRVDYQNRAGEPRTLALDGFAARVVQHEYDHLEGILTIDRAVSPRDIVKASEIEGVLKEEVRLCNQFGER